LQPATSKTEGFATRNKQGRGFCNQGQTRKRALQPGTSKEEGFATRNKQGKGFCNQEQARKRVLQPGTSKEEGFATIAKEEGQKRKAKEGFPTKATKCFEGWVGYKPGRR
jgi:hypothetical protein